jgi:hypothetical protein
MKTVTLTEFRKNIFRLVDEAIATGEPIVMNRKGARVVVRGAKGSTETAEERAERWKRFWASPPEVFEDISLEEIEEAGESYWHWDEGPELDN